MAIRTSPTGNFTDVRNTVQAAGHGDTVIVPHGSFLWGVSDILTINTDIQLIGNDGNGGLDAANATPQASNCTIITVQHTNNSCITTNFQGTENVSRIGGSYLNLRDQGPDLFLTLAAELTGAEG